MNGQDMAQLVEKVSGLSVTAAGVDVIKLPGGREYLVHNKAKGEFNTAPVPAGRHRETLDTPAALLAFVEKVGGGMSKEPADDDVGTVASIFVNEKRVEYLPDIDDGRDRAVCNLIPSPQFAWLQAYGGKPHKQKDFIRVLRITFAGCVDTTLVALCRNLSFSVGKEGYANATQGRESMGRSVVAEVRGESAIPEEVTVQIPLFENHPKPYLVPCAVEVDAMNETFALVPYPLALRRAVDDCLRSIADLFADTVPVFYGDSGRGGARSED